MVNAAEIKELVYASGADLCGIASVDRFSNAPEGFNPIDIYPDTKSVVVFAKKIPESIYFTKSHIPYSFVGDIVLHEILRLTYEVSLRLEKFHISAVPIPSEPYEYWDNENMTGRAILSLKHAGYLAGLGVIGRNSLLSNPEFGTLIQLGAVITNAETEADQIMAYDFCKDTCNLCIESCPSGALISRETVIQKNCRMNSEGSTFKGASVTVCNICRKVCPYRAGWKIERISQIARSKRQN